MEYIAYLLKERQNKITGIIHLGANRCQELECYLNLNVREENIFWIEANPEIVNTTENIKNLSCAAISCPDNEGNVLEFYITSNDSLSSSLYKLGDHLRIYPGIRECMKIEVVCTTLDKWYDETKSVNNSMNPNVLVMDIQGSELDALKGAERVLTGIDYIYTEIQNIPLYQGTCCHNEIKQYLESKGYKEIWYSYYGTAGTWGDAFYERIQ